MRIVVPNLLPGQLYNLQFRSKNDTETSAWSRTWQIQAAVDTIAPKTPTGLVVKTSGDSFVSNWDAVTENEDGSQALDLSHYLVKIRNLANNDTTVQKVFTNEFELTFNLNIALFDPLAASIAVSVASVDAVGNVSAYTDEVTATNPAPGPVRNLVANGVIEGIDITWEPPANLEDDFKEYQVFIGNDPEFEINSTNMVWQGISTSHLYQTTTITPLYVKVVAVDKFNSRSTVVTAGPVTPRSAAEVDTDAPDTPTNLAGTITGTSMTVTWTAPANPDNDLAGYTIQYRKVGETTWSSQNSTHEDTSVVIPVEFQKDYQIRISAHDFSFNRSNWSTIVNVAGEVNTAPATPTGLQIRGAINSAMVVWNKNTESDLKEYEVQFEKHTPTDADEIYTTAGSNMSFVENVTTNTTYYARIRAVDTGGLKSAWSSVVSGTVGFVDIPDVELSDGNPPANSPVATLTGSIKSLYARWTPVTNADPVTYEIHLGTTTGFTPGAGTLVGQTTANFTSIAKLADGTTDLDYDTDYYVKIVAKDADGAAAASGASNAARIQWVPTATDIDGINTRLDNTVRSSVIEYAVNSSETTAPTSGWSTAQPTRTPGTFVWFRTVVTYGDNTTSTSSAALLTGNTGAKGDDGAPAPIVSLTSSTQALVSPPAGGPTTPATAVVTATATGTTVSTWEYNVDGGGWTTTKPSYVSTPSGNSVTVTGQGMSRTLAIRASGGGASDTITIAKVSDGAQGDPGNPGTDAITVILSNESHIIPAGTSAAIAASPVTTTTVIAYKGATQVPVTVNSVTGNPTGMSIGTITGNGTNSPVIPINVTTALTTRSGVLAINVTVDGKAVTKYFSWSLGLTGATGSTGTSITSVTPFYQQTLAAASAPAKPSGTTPPAPWTSTEPSYVAGTALWRTERITYSSGSPSYTDVVKVSSYEAAAAARTIAITADNRVRSGTYAPGNAEKVDAPDGAIWYEYGTATPPVGGTVLKETWRLEGGNWVRRGIIDPTLVPLIDIGTGTFGDLSGGRLVANSVGADQINVNSLVGNTAWLNTLVTSQAFIDNAKIKTANIEGTLTIGQLPAQAALESDVTDARNEAMRTSAHVGILQPSIDLAGQHLVGGWGVAMQTTEPVHIGAATVRADGAGSRTFYLRENNGAGTVLATRTFTLAPGDNRINLDLYLTPGTYALTADSTGPLIWGSNHSSISYPYDSGAFKIIGRAQHGASTIDNTTYFYFFYDMEVAGAGVNGVPIKWRASSDKTTIHGGNIETGTIKADSIDTDSLLADTAFITDLVSTQAFITNLEVTTANITDLTFDKIEGGQGIITNLDIKNTLTVATGGIIQSANYSSSEGYRLTNNELIINNGSISASVLKLQIGQNLVPAPYADFEFPATFYETGALSATGGFSYSISTAARKFGKQSLMITKDTTANKEIFFGATNGDFNIPVEEGKQYIFSLYARAVSVTSGIGIRVRWNNGTQAGSTTTTNVTTAGFTRVWDTFTVPAGVTSCILSLYCATATVGAGWYVDGLQFEEKTSASEGDPSPWSPGTAWTAIDGNMVRTGEIRSNVLNHLGQPQWSLNKDGGMQIGSALIRGTLTVGNTTGENSWVQSATYLPGVEGVGWRINADGSAEFQNVRIGRDSVVEGSLSADFITAGELKANISIGTLGKITAGSATQFSQLDNAGFKFWNIDVEDGGSSEAPMIALGPGDNFLNILVPDPDTTDPGAPPVSVGFGADGTMSSLNAYVARDAVFDGAVHFNQGDLPGFNEGSYGPFINGKHLIDVGLTRHFETHPGLGEQNAWTLGLAYGIVGHWRRPFGSAGFPTPNSNTYRRELARATFYAQQSRVYRVQFSAGPIQRDGGSNTRLDWGKIRLRSSSTAGSGVAWDTGTLVSDADLYLGGGQGEWIAPQGYVYLIGGVDIPAGTVNLLTYIELFSQVSISWGSSAFCEIVVEDVGRWSSNFPGGNPTGVHHGSQSGGGAGGGTVAKEYTKTYTSNATAVFAGTTRVTNATYHKNRLRSGRGGSSTYNSYAYFDDAQIRADIGSGNITKVEIYLYYQGNYPTGDAYVGLHNGASPGSSPPTRYGVTSGSNGAGSRWRFQMGKGRWITISNSELPYNNWKSGTYRGIYVGLPSASSDTIMDFHSHYSGNKPKIRITYRR